MRPYVKIEDKFGESSGILALVFTQDPKLYSETLAILALDHILAMIGGYMNVVIMLLSQFTVYMHYFNMDMSLIKQIYTFDGRDQSSEGTFSTAKDLLRHRLKKRTPFFWSFKGYISASCITCFCCFKDWKCYKKREKTLYRFNELRQRLNHEFDMLEMVRISREARLVSQVVLHKLHHFFIPSFKNYNLNKKDVDRSIKMRARKFKKQPSENLMTKFFPEDNLVDNVVLYNITGFLEEGFNN